MGARRPAATLTGPGVDRGYESPAVALSAAISVASRSAEAVTLYVRDAEGNGYGRVERRDDGSLSIYRTSTKGEKR